MLTIYTLNLLLLLLLNKAKFFSLSLFPVVIQLLQNKKKRFSFWCLDTLNDPRKHNQSSDSGC